MNKLINCALDFFFIFIQLDINVTWMSLPMKETIFFGYRLYCLNMLTI